MIKISTITQAKKILAQALKDRGNPKIAFVGQRASDFLCFQNISTIDLIISLDYGVDAQLIEEFIPVISLEKELKVRKVWYSTQLSDIFANKNLLRQIKNTLPVGSIILPYASTKALEKFASEQGYILFGNTSITRSLFEDKVKLFNIKKQLGLPNPSQIFNTLDMCSMSDLMDQFSEKFVVQTASGSSGTGTFIIQSENDFKKIQRKLRGQKVIVTKFIDGPTVSINAAITDRQIIAMPPSFQVIGNEQTAISKTTFSGVDFSVLNDSSLIKEINLITQKVGTLMRSKGYRGVFNLNIMPKEMVVTDINARFMGSGQLSNQIQLLRGEIPLSLIHLLCFLDVDFKLTQSAMQKISAQKEGAFIVLHSLEKNKNKAKTTLVPGSYEMRKNKTLELQHVGTQYKQLANGAFLIGGSIPQKGKVVEPEAPLLRIFAKEKILDDKSLKLNKKYQSVCEQVYKSLLVH